MCVVSEMILDFRRISEERRCEFENFNRFLRDLRYGFGIVGQAEIVVGRVEIVVGRVESVGEAWEGVGAACEARGRAGEARSPLGGVGSAGRRR